MTEPLKIDVWSDVVCPWCYIGKRNLEAGLAEFLEANPDTEISVEYHSFELSPETPSVTEGSARDQLMEKRGVSAEEADAMIARVVGIAASVGLEYRYDLIRRANTVKAHQVLHLAKEHGLQEEMKERLLKAYFIEGRHVGDDDELADLAESVGIPRHEVVSALADATYLAAVRSDQARARELGISGVPFFVFDDTYGLSGAHPPETFVTVLNRALSDRAPG